STVAGLYQSQVVAVNGVPVASAQQVYRPVAASPPGTPVSYRLQKRGVEREITVPSQRFAVRDWILLFGAYLLNGVVYLTSALAVHRVRARAAPYRRLPSVPVPAGGLLRSPHAQHALPGVGRRLLRVAPHQRLLARHIAARAPACPRVDARHAVRHRLAGLPPDDFCRRVGPGGDECRRLHALPVRPVARLRYRQTRPLRDRRHGEARRLL